MEGIKVHLTSDNVLETELESTHKPVLFAPN